MVHKNGSHDRWDKTWLKFTQDFTQVFEMQNLKVLQYSFKKSEILQILEMLHFKIIQIFRLSTKELVYILRWKQNLSHFQNFSSFSRILQKA
jgi:hypothetical protein